MIGALWTCCTARRDHSLMDRNLTSDRSPGAGEPVQAGRKPVYASLRKGRTYYWCSCGRSKRQPYCDGSHRGTDFEPVAYTASEDGEEVLFCTCKRTGDSPFCDGTHNNLPGGYREDDPQSTANQAIGFTDDTDGPMLRLDGGCYVYRVASATRQRHGNVEYCTVIGPALGARYQSQFHLRTTDDAWTPMVGFGDRDVVLLVGAGQGEIDIAGRTFPAQRSDGLHVRPGECFRIRSSNAACPLSVFVSACPATDAPSWPEGPAADFDARWPDRRVVVDEAQRETMGSRFFQRLVDARVGSERATQFIGHIPPSKAEPHRHLYEESLIVLDGRGVMWTEHLKAPVEAGDVIFLPRKQLHSLQSTAEDGMYVVGVIHPGTNPAINY